MRLRAESARAEHFVEPLDRARPDGLGSVERDPDVREIEVLLRADVGGQVVSEVRSRGEDGRVVRHLPQPALRPVHELRRGHEHRPAAGVNRQAQQLDQAHVVEERDPARAGRLLVRGVGLAGLPAGRDDRPVRDHRARRLARRP